MADERTWEQVEAERRAEEAELLREADESSVDVLDLVRARQAEAGGGGLPLRPSETAGEGFSEHLHCNNAGFQGGQGGNPE
jgi:hypothetical protein